MIHSMTAFASRTGALGQTQWVWDMRGVNARGLDLRLRLPDGMEALETTLRAALKKALHRGAITVGLRLSSGAGGQDLQLDVAQLDRVLQALDLVQERALAAGVTLAQPTAADVLNQRGVVSGLVQGAVDEELIAALASDVAPLLASFTAMRAAEGAALQRVIAAQLDRISALVEQAAAAAEARKAQARQALRAAFERVLAEVTDADEARLAQELALIATRQDVTEEIDRLRAHVAAAWEMLEEDGPSGRKLDFLAQEFNREANTLCAKSQNSALTAVGLELKLVVDQMREQVQNVE